MRLRWIPEPGEDALGTLSSGHDAAWPCADELPFTADGQLLWRWREAGIPHVSLWRFTDLDEQLALAAQARALAERWPPACLAAPYGGFDLLPHCRREAHYLFRDALLAQAMAGRLLDDHAGATLLLPNAPFGAAPLAAMLRWEAAQRAVAVEPVGSPSPARARRTPRGNSRRAADALRLLFDHARLSAAASRARKGGRATILFVGVGADYVNQLATVSALRREDRHSVLHVALGPVLASAYSRSLRTEHGRVLRLAPYASPQRRRELRRVAGRAWLALASGALAGEAPAAIFANPALHDAFRAILLGDVPRSGGVLDTAGRLLDASAARLVVLGNSASPRERAVVAAARRRGIRTAQWVHSGVNDLHVHGAAADWLLAWGDAHREQFAALGVPRERIRVVGNPNYDSAVPGRAPMKAVRSELRCQLGVSDDQILMLLVTARPPRLLSFIDVEQHGRDLSSFCAALASCTGVRLAIKPHPRYDDASVYRDLARRYEWIRVVEDVHLERLLAAADVAAMLNVSTTGGLEAVLSGRPLLWVHPSARYPHGYEYLSPAAVEVTDRSHMTAAIQGLVTSADERERAARRGKAALPGLLAHHDGGATAAALSAIDELVGTGTGHG